MAGGPARAATPDARRLWWLAGRSRRGALFVVGALAPAVANFVLVPIYARYLDVAGFGALVLITAAYGVFSSVSLMGLNSAIVREYYALEHHRARRQLVGAVMGAVTLSGVAGGLGLLLIVHLVPAIGRAIFGTTHADVLVLVAAYFVVQNLYAIQLATARASAQARRYAAVGVFQAAMLVVLSLTLVVGLRLGLTGYVLAALGAAVLGTVGGILMAGTAPVWPSHWRASLAPALAFGMPLVAVNLSGWAMGALDRYLVNALLGIEATATYGLAYKVGSLANPLLIVPITAVFPPVLFRRMSTNGISGALPLLLRVHRWVILAGAGFAVGVTLAAKPLIRFFGSTRYLAGVPTVGWIAFGFLAFASYTIMSNYFALQRNTRRIAVLVAISLAANVVGNLVLIPRYGIRGSAMALFVSYSLLASLAYLQARRSMRAELRDAARVASEGDS